MQCSLFTVQRVQFDVPSATRARGGAGINQCLAKRTQTHKKETRVSVLVTKKRATQQHTGHRARERHTDRQRERDAKNHRVSQVLVTLRGDFASIASNRLKREQVNYFDAFV